MTSFSLILPEISLLIIALVGQLSGVFYQSYSRLIFHNILIIVIVIAIIMFKFPFIQDGNLFGFGSTFVVNSFLNFIKIIVLFFTIAVMIIYKSYCDISGDQLKIEFITLLLFSAIGAFVSISARNFLLLFCAIELQSLASYVLASFNSLSIKSSEAGIKYFVLGSLMSCISLLGISFIYGFSGSLEFNIIQQILVMPDIGLVIGVVLMLSGIMFKLSAAPLHFWTPDVYQGAPSSAVAYFATVQKIALLMVLFNIFSEIINDYKILSIDLTKIIAILSMIIGSLGAINQQSLKRLIAYSSILNIGYVLMGFSLGNAAGREAALTYIIIYLIAVIGFFSCVIALLGQRVDEVTFDDIKGIGISRKAIAGSITIIMFSMIGMPPFAGFFGKYYLFYQVILQEQYMLSVVGILSSVIAAYYYLKVIRVMYFARSVEQIEHIHTNHGLLILTLISVSILLLFAVLPFNVSFG